MTMYITVASAVMLAVLLSSLICNVIYFRSLKGVKNELSGTIRTLQKELNSLNSCTLGVGRRILSLEKRLAHTEGSQEKLPEADFSYSKAISLFDQGMDVDVVAASCGLSQSEASLMALIQNNTDAYEHA